MPDTPDHSSFDGLIFDCDGTLADTMPLHYVAWQNVLTDYGIQFNEPLFYSLAGQPTVTIVDKLLREQELAGDAVKISHEKEQAFLALLPEVQPIQTIVDIAKQFRSTKPMGVGSGSNRDVVLEILQHIGLEGFFDAVVGCEDTQRHKPEPDVFLEVAARIGVAPERCEVFEDADLGIEAARRASMACFDVRTVHTPRRITPV